MGRELRRVALDFEWPLNKIWKGFVNPHYVAKDCPVCNGAGYSAPAQHLYDQWYGKVPFDPSETGSVPLLPTHPTIRALAERNVQGTPFLGIGEPAVRAEAERLCRHFNGLWMYHIEQADVDALWAARRLHDLNPNWRENQNVGVPPPSAATVNEWSLRGMGHDSINASVCVRAKAERLGHPVLCAHCDGDGVIWPSAEAKARYEAWEQIPPPEGPGYQVWETVSEGSPISPVFDTEEKLISWLLDRGYSEGAAEAFAREGWAPSMAIKGDVVYNDIESLNMETGDE